MERQPNTQYILHLSYGKDSLACPEALLRLGYPLDRIVHAEVWATDTIPADLPPMVEFKAHADKIIKERYGIEVEHICAMKNGKKLTYEDIFYRPMKRKVERERIYGFPILRGNWCTSNLKQQALRHGGVSIAPGNSRNKPLRISNLSQPRELVYGTQVFSDKHLSRGADINTVNYFGIAADEPKRIIRHSVPGKVLPLVDIGWTEADCRKWCEENDLLSPIYTASTRGGCWFCHNQGIDQLRLLRKDYPDLWALLLRWDADSPTTFKSDGHTVHDYDRRFQAEDEGKVPKDRKFRWSMLEGGGIHNENHL